MLDDLKSLLQTQRERLRHHGKTISGSTQTKNFRTVSWRRELCAGALLAVWHRAEHVIFVVQAAFRRRNRTDPKRAISDTGRDAVPLNRKLDFSGERLLPKFTLENAAGGGSSSPAFLQYPRTLPGLVLQPVDILSPRISCP